MKYVSMVISALRFLLSFYFRKCLSDVSELKGISWCERTFYSWWDVFQHKKCCQQTVKLINVRYEKAPFSLANKNLSLGNRNYLYTLTFNLINAKKIVYMHIFFCKSPLNALLIMLCSKWCLSSFHYVIKCSSV